MRFSVLCWILSFVFFFSAENFSLARGWKVLMVCCDVLLLSPLSHTFFSGPWFPSCKHRSQGETLCIKPNENVFDGVFFHGLFQLLSREASSNVNNLCAASEWNAIFGAGWEVESININYVELRASKFITLYVHKSCNPSECFVGGLLEKDDDDDMLPS